MVQWQSTGGGGKAVLESKLFLVLQGNRDAGHPSAAALLRHTWGTPHEPNASGSCGERRSSAMSEPPRLRGGEGYGACDDDGRAKLLCWCRVIELHLPPHQPLGYLGAEAPKSFFRAFLLKLL